MSSYSQLTSAQTPSQTQAAPTCAPKDFGSNQGLADQIASADLQGGAMEAFGFGSDMYGAELDEAGFSAEDGALGWSGAVEADADDGQPFDASGNASWRKDGADVGGEVGWSTDTESEGLSVQTGMTLSGGASVTVSTARVPSSDPCEGLVAVTVDVDLAAGIGGQMGFSKDETSAGMGGHLEGEGHWSATKVLAEGDVLGLVSSVNNGSEELLLGTFGQLKAVLDVGPDAVSEDFSAMKAGEARSYSGSVDAMLCLTMSHAGVGGEVKGQFVGERSFSVVAVSDQEREVRVAFRTSATTSGKGGVPLGIMVLGAEGSQTEELGFEAAGLLRLPEDAALLAALEDVDTATDLELLQGKHAGALPNFRYLEGSASSSGGSVGSSVLAFAWGHEESRRDEVGVEEGAVVGTIEGGAGSSIGVESGGAEASRKTSTGISAKVDGDDSSAVLTTKEESAWSVQGMVDWMTGSAELGPVEEAMASARAGLSSTSLSDGDLDTLFEVRAQNPVLWNACCGDPRGHGAWVTTGLRIRAPQLDDRLAASDPAGARRVAQLQALADFVGGQADAVVQRTLEAVTTGFGVSVLGAELGEAIGTRGDWPAGTADVKEEWLAVIGQLDALDACEAAAVGAGDAAIFESLAWMVWDDLGLLSESVSALDITDTGFVAGKITEVAVLRTSVVERIRAVQLLTGAETCVQADGSVGADAVDVDTVELEGLMDAVEGFKVQEGVVFAALGSMAPGFPAMQAADKRLGALYTAWSFAQRRVDLLLATKPSATVASCVEPDGDEAVVVFVAVSTGNEMVAKESADAFVARQLAPWRS